LDSLHITDQKPYNNYPLWFKASLYLDASSPSSLQETSKLLKALFALVDRVVTLRLSKDTRAKADKNRKAVEKVKQKEKSEEQEEALLAKKREEKLKYQEKLKSLPPEQQRKLEEKKREKEMQQLKKRMSKMVKF
jgi:Protein of unknown function (DUF1682)